MKKRTAALTALCAAALCACLAGCAKEMTPEDLAGAPEGAAGAESREPDSGNASGTEDRKPDPADSGNAAGPDAKDNVPGGESGAADKDSPGAGAAGQDAGPAIADASASSEEAQLALIAQNASLWLGDTSFGDTYQYAVTDLDQNGRLEILTSSLQGTGLYTYSTFHEVNKTMDGLDSCPMAGLSEGDSQPDIQVSQAGGRFDPASGVRYYLFTDLLRNGAAEQYEFLHALSLSEGTVRIQPLGGASYLTAEDGTVSASYALADGTAIDEADFLTLSEDAFPGCEPFQASFCWIGGPDGTDPAVLGESALQKELARSLAGFSTQ